MDCPIVTVGAINCGTRNFFQAGHLLEACVDNKKIRNLVTSDILWDRNAINREGFTESYNSILAPMIFKNSLMNLGWAGQAGEVTKLPST